MRLVYDEKDFTLQVPLNHQNDRVYGACEKKEISAKRLSRCHNKQSIKVMVSSCVTWNGATKPANLHEQERPESQYDSIKKAS